MPTVVPRVGMRVKVLAHSSYTWLKPNFSYTISGVTFTDIVQFDRTTKRFYDITLKYDPWAPQWYIFEEFEVNKQFTRENVSVQLP